MGWIAVQVWRLSLNVVCNLLLDGGESAIVPTL